MSWLESGRAEAEMFLQRDLVASRRRSSLSLELLQSFYIGINHVTPSVPSAPSVAIIWVNFDHKGQDRRFRRLGDEHHIVETVSKFKLLVLFGMNPRAPKICGLVTITHAPES